MHRRTPIFPSRRSREEWTTALLLDTGHYQAWCAQQPVVARAIVFYRCVAFLGVPRKSMYDVQHATMALQPLRYFLCSYCTISVTGCNTVTVTYSTDRTVGNECLQYNDTNCHKIPEKNCVWQFYCDLLVHNGSSKTLQHNNVNNTCILYTSTTMYVRLWSQIAETCVFLTYSPFNSSTLNFVTIFSPHGNQLYHEQSIHLINYS